MKKSAYISFGSFGLFPELLLLSVFFLFPAFSAAGLTETKTADVIVLSNDANGATVRYRVVNVVWDTLKVDDREYRTPRVQGTALSWNAGVPQLPARVI